MTARHGKENDHKYETRDAHLSRVMVTAFSLIGIMVFGMAFAWGVYEIFRTQSVRPEMGAETFILPDTSALPPGPNLEADPALSLAALRVREDAILNGYGWTDSAKGVARVPVAKAMELYLQQDHRK